MSIILIGIGVLITGIGVTGITSEDGWESTLVGGVIGLFGLAVIGLGVSLW